MDLTLTFGLTHHMPLARRGARGDHVAGMDDRTHVLDNRKIIELDFSVLVHGLTRISLAGGFARTDIALPDQQRV
jgi:hypothetical protein